MLLTNQQLISATLYKIRPRGVSTTACGQISEIATISASTDFDTTHLIAMVRWTARALQLARGAPLPYPKNLAFAFDIVSAHHAIKQAPRAGHLQLQLASNPADPRTASSSKAQRSCPKPSA